MAEYTELILNLRKVGRKIIQFGNPIYNEVTAQRMLDAADAIEELSKPKWIPVTERLPEKTNHYLVHIECKCDGELMSKWTQIAWFCKKFYWEHSHGTEFFEETVTHWMPLPEPPKEET